MIDTTIEYNEVVVCLFDGDYHFGLAALVNSLVKNNFKGYINAAYRGVLPPWIKQLEKIGQNTFKVSNNVIIHYENIETDMNLAFYKPYFIAQTFKDFSAAEKVFYFDVDIVVNAPWSFFSNWLNDQVCLCLDSSYEYVHSNHPWRKDWKRLANLGEDFFSAETAYVNSGFIGITKINLVLIEKWRQLTERFSELGGSLKTCFQDGHNSYKGDQDMLNAAITVLPGIKLSLIGKEGMGFSQPAYLMTHAIAKAKPWNKNYLKHLIFEGQKPTYPERNFFSNSQTPIILFSRSTNHLKKTNLFLATLLGRFIGY